MPAPTNSFGLALDTFEPTDLPPSFCLWGPPGTGKCLGPDTRVLMFDGTLKRAADVKIGDRLMGPDSKPRRVLGTTMGVGPMFEIRPVKGDPWLCNDAHVLTLVRSGTGEVRDVPLADVERLPERARWKQFATGVNFAPMDERLPIDPYFLGLWFGDGTKEIGPNGVTGVGVTKPDPEVAATCESIAAAWGLAISRIESNRCPTYRLVGERGKPNALLDVLRTVVGTDIDVPYKYLTASRADRAAFLAGWLDADGFYTCGGYEIAQKRSDWAQAICFLARSLGLRATCRLKTVPHYGTYHKVFISGDCAALPLRIPRKKAQPREQIKDVLRTGFSIHPVGHGPYAGFELDGDGRFLLGDFTVTHNSTMAGALGPRILYVQTRPDALRMAFDMWKRGLAPQPPVHRITLDENFLRERDPATGQPYTYFYTAICSIVTRFIHARIAGTNEYDGIIFDEWSTILDRVWMELAADPWGMSRSPKNPNVINIFAVMDHFRKFHSTMIGVARQTRLLVGFISHYQLPTYHEDGPEKGRVKVPGGPKVPENVKPELIRLCAEISAVLEVRVEKPQPQLMGLMGPPIVAPQPVAAPGTTTAAPPPTLAGLMGASAASSAQSEQKPPEPAPSPTPAPALSFDSIPDEGYPRVLLTNLEPAWFRKITGYGVKAREELALGRYGLREVLVKAGFPVPKV